MADGHISGKMEVVGFWLRALATAIDTFLILAVTFPFLLFVYGKTYFESTAIIKGPMDFLISYILPAIAVIIFWKYRSATPGKMMFKAIIVDADTGGKPSDAQLIIRYFAYFISMIPLFLGFFWVAFDNRKQAWHDKLANTLIIRPMKKGPIVLFK